LRSHTETAAYSSALGQNSELQQRWLVAATQRIAESNGYIEALDAKINQFTSNHVMKSITDLQMSGQLDYDSVSQFRKAEMLLVKDQIVQQSPDFFANRT
jgi:hypothetical protein